MAASTASVRVDLSGPDGLGQRDRIKVTERIIAEGVYVSHALTLTTGPRRFRYDD
jgi:hypothetical protein